MKTMFALFLMLIGVLLASINFDDLGFTENMLINFVGFTIFIFSVNTMIKKSPI